MKNNDNLPANLQRPPIIRFKGNSRRVILWARHTRKIYWILGLSVVLALYLSLVPDNVLIKIYFAIADHSILIIMLFIFGLLSLSLVWSTGQRFDTAVFMFFNTHGWRPLWLDYAMLAFTQIGNGIATFSIALILFLGVNHLLAYELILGTLTLWLVVEILKSLIKRNRPFNTLKEMRTVGLRERGRSFPSGHTSQAFFVATLLVNYFNTGFGLGFLLYATGLLVGITRMYVGMHYPRDVLAGAILGTVWGSIGMVINGYIFARF